ncbi:hypothetical protein LTR64_004667 [Lithohypha guttulata]|uniref:uncharacterized protein n=1 Tax=Lithohypha guttulata TaxID=1690604 RepID=UPI002DE1E210|nr:hypothetical protein LTR51_006036 [Lithohypha guttulata]
MFAKRYERMLKSHGVHPHGGVWDSSAHRREDAMTSPMLKQPRKRKQDETLTFFRDEDDDVNIQKTKRLCTYRQPRVKQELPSQIPPTGYPAYMYHPAFVQQPYPYMQHLTQSGMGHPPPFTGGTLAHPPFHQPQGHSSAFAMTSQLSPFTMPAQPLQPASDHQPDYGALNDIYNQNFSAFDGFENLLQGDEAMSTNAVNDSKPLMDLTEADQTVAEPKHSDSVTIKSEPTPILDVSERSLVTANKQDVPSTANPFASPSLPILSNTLVAPLRSVQGFADTIQSQNIDVKQEENEDCIFLIE